MGKEYSRTVEMICPLCGSTTIIVDDENPNTNYICGNCHKTFTKEQLINENQENIDINLSELQKEATKDVEKEIQNILKKAFK
jgi:ribosomal protein S27AE